MDQNGRLRYGTGTTPGYRLATNGNGTAEATINGAAAPPVPIPIPTLERYPARRPAHSRLMRLAGKLGMGKLT